jgi:hypothetical protein
VTREAVETGNGSMEGSHYMATTGLRYGQMTGHSIADVFQEAYSRYGVKHERMHASTPDKNAQMEAFHRLLEEERLSLHGFETYAMDTSRRQSTWSSTTPGGCTRLLSS